MNELIDKPGLPSPPPITMDGLEFLNFLEISWGVAEIFESQ